MKWPAVHGETLHGSPAGEGTPGGESMRVGVHLHGQENVADSGAVTWAGGQVSQAGVTRRQSLAD